ncbi:MAG TPA: lactate racemase domain-containing protein [Planctomycetota bacterium]|nr:lactate racemase domain-containing protein [Planctomycetota bacterium]
MPIADDRSGNASRSILFAAGTRGISLSIPAGVEYVPVSHPIQDGAAQSAESQRARVMDALAKPISGVPLKELARGKRRAVILAGDLSRPAPYDIALSAIISELVAAELRPTRIACVACPGTSGALLGRAAIRRYGEEICGDHEVLAWPATGSPGALFDAADLRIAVAPSCEDGVFDAFLPRGVNVDFSLELKLGRKLGVEIESVRSSIGQTFAAARANNQKSLPHPFDVLLISGGGAPWEETLEEALLSLHEPRVAARTAVLIFSGDEGLGSAHFARDVWSLIAQAEEVLVSGGSLGAADKTVCPLFDPASTLAECLRRYSNTVLFSPGLAEHVEGQDLLERLEEAPRVAGRLALCGAEEELWGALRLIHSERYTLCAEPLGWRWRA